MITPIPLPEERSEGGYGLCPSLPGKWMSVVMVTLPILFWAEAGKDTMVLTYLLLSGV